MSLEQPQEQPRVTREAVLEALKAHGTEQGEIKELFGKFIEQKQNEIEKISDQKEHIVACFNMSIETAELYYEAGLFTDALETLTETGEAAWDRNETEICDRIKTLMDKVEEKIKRKE